MWVDPVGAAWLREYRYLQVSPMTHEQYLDEPLDAIEWLTRIHGLDEAAKEKRAREGDR